MRLGFVSLSLATRLSMLHCAMSPKSDMGGADQRRELAGHANHNRKKWKSSWKKRTKAAWQWACTPLRIMGIRVKGLVACWYVTRLPKYNTQSAIKKRPPPTRASSVTQDST